MNLPNRREQQTAIMLVLAIVLVNLVGAVPVLAANTNTEVTADETPHTINSVTLMDATGNMLSSPVTLNPRSTYQVEVNVSDHNLLADIDQVQVALFYDADGAAPVPLQGDAAQAALLTWTRDDGSGAPAFQFDAGNSLTWALDASASSAPDDTQTTGNWTFQFTVGDVARETETGTDSWRMSATATDNSGVSTEQATLGTFNNGQRAMTMNHYSRLEAVTSSISLGNALPGQILPQTPIIDLTAVANGGYSLELAVDPQWHGAAGNSLDTVSELTDAQQIRLVGMGGNVLSGNLKSYTDMEMQLLGTVPTPVSNLFNVAGPTAELGNDHDVEVAARFSDSVKEDIYGGTIYLIITDSSGDS